MLDANRDDEVLALFCRRTSYGSKNFIALFFISQNTKHVGEELLNVNKVESVK